MEPSNRIENVEHSGGIVPPWGRKRPKGDDKMAEKATTGAEHPQNDTTVSNAAPAAGWQVQNLTPEYDTNVLATATAGSRAGGPPSPKRLGDSLGRFLKDAGYPNALKSADKGGYYVHRNDEDWCADVTYFLTDEERKLSSDERKARLEEMLGRFTRLFANKQYMVTERAINRKGYPVLRFKSRAQREADVV